LLREAEDDDDVFTQRSIDVHTPADAEQILLGGSEVVGGPFSPAIDHLLDDLFPLRPRPAGREDAVRIVARTADALERQCRLTLGFLSARSHRGADNDRQTSHEYRGRHADRT